MWTIITQFKSTFDTVIFGFITYSKAACERFYKLKWKKLQIKSDLKDSRIQRL